jgi:hypothetical protein
VRWLVLLVALVLGAGTTWLLTVHSVTRSLPVGGTRGRGGPPASGGPVTPATRTSAPGAEPEEAAFGGSATPASVDTHGAGARWMPDAEDEDALLHPHGSSGPVRGPEDRSRGPG